jgi:hypothetical protein
VVALMHKRVYDIAGVLGKTVKVRSRAPRPMCSRAAVGPPRARRRKDFLAPCLPCH